MWSMDQKPWKHLVACGKRSPEHSNQSPLHTDVHLNQAPGDLHAHYSVGSVVLIVCFLEKPLKQNKTAQLSSIEDKALAHLNVDRG